MRALEAALPISTNPLHPRYSRAADLARRFVSPPAVAPGADADLVDRRPFDARTGRHLTREEAADPFYLPPARSPLAAVVHGLALIFAGPAMRGRVLPWRRA